jgi:hypothetical protein
MPRKQRFKPSRKPKPTPPSEDALTGRPTSNARANNDNVDARDAPPARDEASVAEPDLGSRAR